MMSRGDVQAFLELAQHMLAVARSIQDEAGIRYWNGRVEYWRGVRRSMAVDMKGK
jgi:hypothetical protein